MDYDEFYCIQSSLQNFKLLKLAYDYGLDVSTYKDFHATSYEGNWGNYDTFITLVYDLFEIVDVWGPYNDDREENLEKSYWLRQAWKDASIDSVESDGVIVILDDRLKKEHIRDGGVWGGLNDFYYGYAEIYPLEQGVVIQYNEDDGEVNWVDVLYYLILTLTRSEQTNEVAI
ncbi:MULTISPECIES: hypothetical protein [Bacillati]|uniref:hypothetical protein n=1 Tax=Bacillati TaxID=1783272 RepID=UPI0022B9A30B|nr:hypothetical protein [Caldifermentibacillus hisashii]